MRLQVAETWYETEAFSDGITLIRESHVAQWLRCNIWHVRGRGRDLIIDTGMGLRALSEAVASLAERPVVALMTHSHFDHSGGMHQFDCRCGHAAEADIILAPTAHNTVADTGFLRADTFTALPYEGFDYSSYQVRPAPLTHLVDEGDVIDLGDRVFQVLHLPGHSPGSITLYEHETGVLFSGDVIYDGALLDNLYHSDPQQLEQSLLRLKQLPVTTIHGGHYASFDHDRMLQLIDSYLRGDNRIEDVDSWIAASPSA